jgi:glyoxylase-like metal-dependent hydrolase (beta-lactamase superfamily II)
MKINRASSGAEERRNGFQGSLTRFRNLLVAVAILLGGTNVAVPVGLLSFYSLTFANESVAQAVTQRSGVSLSKNSKLVQNQAGFYRMNVGDIDVIALSDGTVGLGVLDGLLLNARSGEIESLLAEHYQKSPTNGSINAFLIRIAGRLILVDAGSSELVGPTANKLPDSLKAVGVQPEQITDVFLTHIHPDHSGGLMEGNHKVFPNATIHVDKREVAYWFDKSIAATAPEPLKTFFSQVDPKIKPYLDSGQLKTFDGATEFFPGFRSQPAYGHTPGHTLYVLESAGEKMVFCGDLVHVEAVQFHDPSICIRFDTDSNKAAEQRKTTFADAADNGYLLAFAHVSFPGVGHVRREGDHYRWIPLQYVNDALKQEPQPLR